MKIVLIFIMALLLTGCAKAVEVPEGVNLSGFLGGLWHGIIMIFSFVGSLFSDNIAVYAVYNNGGWYDFGFLLGVGAFAGGASSRG